MFILSSQINKLFQYQLQKNTVVSQVFPARTTFMYYLLLYVHYCRLFPVLKMEMFSQGTTAYLYLPTNNL